MMRHLMRDHICCGKITARTHLLTQHVKETCVQIGLAVRRTVKRPTGPRGTATGALRGPVKDYQYRRHISAAQLFLEHFTPDILGVGQDLR